MGLPDIKVLCCGLIIGRSLKSLQKDFQDKLAHASSTAEESISNVRTVRFFSNENKMVSLYGKDIDLSYLLGKKLSAVIGTYIYMMNYLIGHFTVLWNNQEI